MIFILLQSTWLLKATQTLTIWPFKVDQMVELSFHHAQIKDQIYMVQWLVKFQLLTCFDSIDLPLVISGAQTLVTQTKMEELITY